MLNSETRKPTQKPTHKRAGLRSAKKSPEQLTVQDQRLN
ncbi:Hypothetical protein LCAKO_0750 [Lacticaseibacillus paracasei subsp. paracasei]|uniref:Uncharacterized protein n=1 Tax=Lacticaseibacillus paracasei subsp. paracasei TaxID=47714 RepID=A0AAP9KUS4_LACPA|nr:Hypothetical protein LCAKO_0750 [Lacticaseibacillus paracasei subsp. paracasei]